MTRTMLTIYAPMRGWLVKLAEGWRLVEFPLVPVSERGWTVMMFADEEWRTIEEWPYYEVSNFGDVRKTRDGHILRAGDHVAKWINATTGYPCVSLSDNGRKHRTVHSLVADAFLSPRPTSKHQVAHNDGSRTNNFQGNLRWATPAENQADRKQHGTWLGGGSHPNAKLTWEEAEEIRQIKRLTPETTISSLSRQYGIARKNIRLILSNCTYVREQPKPRVAYRGIGDWDHR